MISIKGHNLLPYLLFSKKFRKWFILLTAFYLNMWLMKLPKKSEKIAISKIVELVSFWGVKTDSVRNKLNLSIKYWFMEAKIVFCIYDGPKKGLTYHVETVQATFSENNEYYRTIFVKLNIFHAWKCIISGVKYRSMFWHLRRKLAVIFSKWLFFQNSLVISWVT